MHVGRHLVVYIRTHVVVAALMHSCLFIVKQEGRETVRLSKSGCLSMTFTFLLKYTSSLLAEGRNLGMPHHAMCIHANSIILMVLSS